MKAECMYDEHGRNITQGGDVVTPMDAVPVDAQVVEAHVVQAHVVSPQGGVMTPGNTRTSQHDTVLP